MSSLCDRRIGGEDATAGQVFTLRRMGRFLWRVEAVHAISLLWPSNSLSTAQGVEGTKRTHTARQQLTPMLALMGRRAGVCRVHWTAVFRHVNKNKSEIAHWDAVLGAHAASAESQQQFSRTSKQGRMYQGLRQGGRIDVT
ncbi:unnamed protein product [Scytosiphon promiscuus]